MRNINTLDSSHSGVESLMASNNSHSFTSFISLPEQ